MTKQEILIQLKQTYDQQFIAINSLPDIDFIGHISNDTVFLEDVKLFTDFLNQLSHFDETRIKFEHEYLGSGCLAIKYSYGDVDIVFFCEEIEKALHEISDGNCVLDSITTPAHKTQTISCVKTKGK